MGTTVTGTADVGSASTAAAVGETESPAFPHPTYTKRKPRWEKCRAFMGESQEIRDGGETYLFRIGAEGDDSYDARLRLVAITNFFKRAVLASVGMLLQKEPELGGDMPKKLVQFSENIDLSGKHITVYARDLATDYIIDGVVGTLTDYPKLDDPNLDWSKASQAAVIARETGGQLDSNDEEALGMRPFFVRYTRADILKVVYAKINGATDKVLVVLRETSEKLDGSFGIKSVVRYRVFKRTQAGVTWEVWEGEGSDTSVRRIINPTPLRVGGQVAKRIPFSLMGDFDGLPPLENLADLNIEHHNLKTNRRNIEMLAMVPTRVRIGAQKDKDGNYPPLKYGARETIEAPVIEGVQRPIYWDSPPVDVLGPADNSLEDVKSDIGTAALNFMAPQKRVAETAEAKRLDDAAQQASLSLTGRLLQDHLEESYGFAAEMIRETGGSVVINTDFEDPPLSAEEMGKYLDAYLSNGISRETFLDSWKRGKRLDETLDPAKEAEKILKDNATPKENDKADGDE